MFVYVVLIIYFKQITSIFTFPCATNLKADFHGYDFLEKQFKYNYMHFLIKLFMQTKFKCARHFHYMTSEFSYSLFFPYTFLFFFIHKIINSDLDSRTLVSIIKSKPSKTNCHSGRSLKQIIIRKERVIYFLFSRAYCSNNGQAISTVFLPDVDRLNVHF